MHVFNLYNRAVKGLAQGPSSGSLPVLGFDLTTFPSEVLTKTLDRLPIRSPMTTGLEKTLVSKLVPLGKGDVHLVEPAESAR